MPKLEFLSKDDVEKLHLTSLKILEEIGIKIFDDYSLKLLNQAGAIVDFKQNIVKIPEYLLLDLIKKAPAKFKLYSREARYDFEVGDGKPHFSTGNAFYVLSDGKSQRITAEDLANYIKIADYLKNIHFCVGTNISDVPQRIWDVYEFEIMANNSSKHLRPVIATPDGAKYIIRMAKCICGGEEILRRRPIFSVGYASESPLRWGTTALQVFRETAKYNIPVNIESETLTGGTSPVTLAGTIVLSNAEVLSGIFLNQLYQEGRPCVYSIGFTHTFDLKTAVALSGSPEAALIACIGAQMARYYGLPSLSWVCSDSKIPDAQAAYEKAISFFLHAFSGNDLIWGAGSLEGQLSFSFEQTLIDAEVIDAIMRVMEGVMITDKTLALDIIQRVGIGGTFLKEKHTLDFYLREHLSPLVTDRSLRGMWEKTGSKDMTKRAKDKLQEILKTHQPIPLDHDLSKELRKIVEDAKRELAR